MALVFTTTQFVTSIQRLANDLNAVLGEHNALLNKDGEFICVPQLEESPQILVIPQRAAFSPVIKRALATPYLVRIAPEVFARRNAAA